jgi:2-polyprenyl-3-methyl-5-hydroxy-6-metoxy-1,4-benzoquinol methylase
MKISGGLSENGVVVGNTYDKYGSRNPIVRNIMRGFESTLQQLVDEANPASIHEVGCGEGYWVSRWSERGIPVRGSDFSETVIELARNNAIENNLSPGLFKQRSVYDLQPEEDSADLVVCCEVLEHLEQPDQALLAIQTIVRKHAVFSVPREPLWSVLNMARGKYWADFGNTPGHIQRWSQRDFIKLISRYFKVKKIRAPLPWTMLLCCPQGSSAL